MNKNILNEKAFGIRDFSDLKNREAGSGPGPASVTTPPLIFVRNNQG